MKRIIGLLIAAILFLAAASCRKSTDYELSEEAEPTPTAPIVVMNELPIHSDTWEDILNEEVPPPTPTPFVLSLTSGRERSASFAYQPVFVCYDNKAENRPLTGINEADIIYEAKALEGDGGTRLIALFSDVYPAQVGPVGMTYHDFEDLLKEWKGMLIHEGYPTQDGYPKLPANDVASRITNSGDAKDFFFTPDNAKGLFVNLNRLVPKLYTHNPFDEEIRFLLAEGYSYADAAAVSKLSISFFDNGETIEYVYDAKTNLYERRQTAANGRLAGATALSWNEESNAFETVPIRVNNVIVQYANPDSSGLSLVGSGSCDFFVSGAYLSGTWAKASTEEPTYYYLQDGQTVTLETGCTWIILCSSGDLVQVFK